VPCPLHGSTPPCCPFFCITSRVWFLYLDSLRCFGMRLSLRSSFLSAYTGDPFLPSSYTNLFYAPRMILSSISVCSRTFSLPPSSDHVLLFSHEKNAPPCDSVCFTLPLLLLFLLVSIRSSSSPYGPCHSPGPTFLTPHLYFISSALPNEPPLPESWSPFSYTVFLSLTLGFYDRFTSLSMNANSRLPISQDEMNSKPPPLSPLKRMNSIFFLARNARASLGVEVPPSLRRF